MLSMDCIRRLAICANRLLVACCNGILDLEETDNVEILQRDIFIESTSEILLIILASCCTYLRASYAVNFMYVRRQTNVVNEIRR